MLRRRRLAIRFICRWAVFVHRLQVRSVRTTGGNETAVSSNIVPIPQILYNIDVMRELPKRFQDRKDIRNGS